jgi:hypothetical protein
MRPMRARARIVWLSSLFPAALALSGCAPRSDSLTIVVSGGPFESVAKAAGAESRVDWWDANPRDDDACTESWAALELQRFLPTCLGLRPERIRFADSLPPRGDVLLLGQRRSHPMLARLADGEAPPPQGYRLATRRQEGRLLVVVEGGDRAGALYGAYALLERLGMRFHGLGDTGTVAPRRPSSWPDRLDERSSPAFDLRGFWAWEPRGNRAFFEWMGRNRMNLWTSADTSFVPLLKKLGVRLDGGGHTLQAQFLDPRRHFSSHPEWYGLHEGRRSPNITGESGDNFCTSNAAARAELSRQVVASLASGSMRHADLVEVWMLDGGRWCACEPCRAQGGPSDRVLAVAADVAAAVDSARRAGRIGRPVEVRALAYHDTRQPPSRPAPRGVTVAFYPYFRCYAHALGDSSCTEVNVRIAADLGGWLGTVEPGRMALCEYWNVGAFHSLPSSFARGMATDLRSYRRSRARAISYMHAPTRLWGTWTLHQALFARLAWRPETSADSFVTSFCRELYPGAEQEAVSFFTELERASANLMALQASAGVYGSAAAAGRLTDRRLPVFPLLHLRDSTFHPPANDGPDLQEIEAAMAKARAHLSRALGSARTPIVRARLEEVERRFGYGEAMLAFYAALLRTADADRRRDGDRARLELGHARSAKERLAGIRDLVQVSASHANAADGYEASRLRPTFEHFERLYGR